MSEPFTEGRVPWGITNWADVTVLSKQIHVLEVGGGYREEKAVPQLPRGEHGPCSWCSQPDGDTSRTPCKGRLGWAAGTLSREAHPARGSGGEVGVFSGRKRPW